MDCHKVWGDRYIMDKCHYTNNRSEIIVTCREHGDFRILAGNFLHGHGCPICGNVHHYTTEEFKEKIRGIHGDKYILDNVKYVNTKTKICLTCPEHGDFWISPNKLLTGQGCPECGRERIYNSLRLTIPEIIERANRIHNNRYTYEHFTEYTNNASPITATCPIHGDFQQTVASHLAGCGCPVCFSTSSKAEVDIKEYVESLGFKVESRNRKILNGMEIDIYVPSKKFGIEYNGLYWHNEKQGKDRHYHITKTEEAERNGIKLMQIFEDEWNANPEIVKGKIAYMLGVNKHRIKIGARKCIINRIDKSEAKEFLNKWHIQGFSSGTVYYGAFYNNELVGVTVFTDYKKSGGWELSRFATNGKYSVAGLGSKMFKYFLHDKDPLSVKSFADRRWTLNKENNLYTKMGFVLEEVGKPEYRYVVGAERKHKFGFRKQILSKKYGVPLEWTEREMCDALGFYRIWDCGLFKYV